MSRLAGKQCFNCHELKMFKNEKGNYFCSNCGAEVIVPSNKITNACDKCPNCGQYGVYPKFKKGMKDPHKPVIETHCCICGAMFGWHIEDNDHPKD